MKYSLKHLVDDKYLICDEQGTPAAAQPVSRRAGESIIEKWNAATPTKLRGPAASGFSDAGTSALVAVMEKYQFVIPAKRQADWRAKHAKGAIPSLGISTATLVATDGVVAYFVLGDDETLFFGHLAAFEEDKEEREAPVKRPKVLSSRQQLLASL